MVEIQDMYLAALLLSYGFEYKGVDKSDQKRQRFLFEGGYRKVWLIIDDDPPSNWHSSVEDVISNYISQSILFPANYPEALKRIKFIIHSEEGINDQERKRGGSDKMYASRSEISSVG